MSFVLLHKKIVKYLPRKMAVTISDTDADHATLTPSLLKIQNKQTNLENNPNRILTCRSKRNLPPFSRNQPAVIVSKAISQHDKYL